MRSDALLKHLGRVEDRAPFFLPEKAAYRPGPARELNLV